MALKLSERRRTRRKLYELLAVLHAGPLGADLVPQVRRVAAALDLGELPETPASFPAELHRWSYGYCPGNPQLGCAAAAPVGCLAAKFTHLARSAGKGAAARRQREAEYIETHLLPCLQTVHKHMQIDAYRALIALSAAVVRQDAASLRAQA